MAQLPELKLPEGYTRVEAQVDCWGMVFGMCVTVSLKAFLGTPPHMMTRKKRRDMAMLISYIEDETQDESVN